MKNVGKSKEPCSKGILFSLIVWNKGIAQKLSKGKGDEPVLLEESENELQAKGKILVAACWLCVKTRIRQFPTGYSEESFYSVVAA